MPTSAYSFSGIGFSLSFPDEIKNTIHELVRDFQQVDGSTFPISLKIEKDGRGIGYLIGSGTGGHVYEAQADGLAEMLYPLIQDKIIKAVKPGISFRAAALSSNGKIVLFPGVSSVGKSMLASFLVSRDFKFLADELVYQETGSAYHYLCGPLNIRRDDCTTVSNLLGDRIAARFGGDKTCYTLLEHSEIDQNNGDGVPSLVVFPRFVQGAHLKIEALSPGRGARELATCLYYSSGLGFHRSAALARSLPILMLTYSSLDQLEYVDGALSYILEGDISRSVFERLLATFQPITPPVVIQVPQEIATPEVSPPEPAALSIPEATPAGPKKRLTIGMATYDDYDGVYFSVQAVRLFHPEVTEQTEIIVIDNNPEGACAQDLKRLEQNVANYRYIPFKEQTGTAVRDQIFRQANADYVLSMDCHVLIQPGGLQRLLDYLDQQEDCRDLLQGPMLSDDLAEISTHFEEVWGGGMYGRWATDERAADIDAEPFEIPMQGLGLFVCKKEAWVGFNPRFRGFGGEEGYVHEKFRRRGGKVICLPFLRWVHRFARPLGVPYLLNWHDRIFNYLTGLQENGLDSAAAREHFSELLGKEPAADIFRQVEEELKSPFFFFDAIYCITLDFEGSRARSIMESFKALGIEKRVRFFEAIATPENHHIGCALAHRKIICQARQYGFENVLVFEDDAIFLDDTIACLRRNVADLQGVDWNLFYLGGYGDRKSYPTAENCRYLKKPSIITCTHAIAYNRSVFEKLANDIPATPDNTEGWIGKHVAIDQYLLEIDKRFVAEPAVTTQVAMLPHEDEKYRKRFTLGEANNNEE